MSYVPTNSNDVVFLSKLLSFLSALNRQELRNSFYFPGPVIPRRCNRGINLPFCSTILHFAPRSNSSTTIGMSPPCPIRSLSPLFQTMNYVLQLIERGAQAKERGLLDFSTLFRTCSKCAVLRPRLGKRDH